MSGFVAVRTKYYKDSAARSELDHCLALRDGTTNSNNVFSEQTNNNTGKYFLGNSCIEAYEICKKTYKSVTGKKCRSDMNTLFEHIVILSEAEYTKRENKHGADGVKKAVMQCFEKYAKAIKDEFGFEPLGMDFHLDEGRYEEEKGRFVRNIHCHIQFFNYDFNKKISPLRGLKKKGCGSFDKKVDKTKQLNPNFVKMQDLAASAFERTAFKRGISKEITGIEHLKKRDFVIAELSKKQTELVSIERSVSDSTALLINYEQAIEETKKNLKIAAIGLKAAQNELEQFQKSAGNQFNESINPLLQKMNEWIAVIYNRKPPHSLDDIEADYNNQHKLIKTALAPSLEILRDLDRSYRKR